ncbi:MAG: energy-coupling factor transporter transmembrane component T, partial [Pseudothermotoga sp.]|uniref:energy-coupling factor transporter transmembrane component T family protein n=1 Tax=Pseudothermotoga sp. TaxID=2033661 RepID=UPI00258E1DE3
MALALFFTSRSTFNYITLFSTLSILMLLSRVGLRIFLFDLLKFKWFLLIIFFVQIIPFASANLTGSLVRASRSVLLVSFSILATSLIFRTTSNVMLARAFEVILRGLGMKKVARKISLMIMLALTQIPILFEQMERIRTAQTLRGQTWRTKNPVRALKSLESIVVPLLFFSLKRAESLSVSLEMRKYNIS